MRFPRCSCSKQWGDGQLNWQTKHMIGFGMGGNHQLVLSFGFFGLLRVSKSGVYTRKQGLPPQFIGGFRTCFSGFDVFWDVFLASLILRFCIYNYIYVHMYIYMSIYIPFMTYWIHVAGGQGTPLDSIDGHPWQERFSSMKEECSSWSFHVFWIFQPIFAGLTQLTHYLSGPDARWEHLYHWLALL